MKLDLDKKDDRKTFTDLIKQIRHLEQYSKAYDIEMLSCLLGAALEAAKEEMIVYLYDSKTPQDVGIDFQNEENLQYLDFDKSIH